MSFSRSETINIDRYFASLEIAEPEVEQLTIPVEEVERSATVEKQEQNAPAEALEPNLGGIQPYQPANYTHYFAHRTHGISVEANPKPLMNSGFGFADDVCSRKLSRFLTVDSLQLAALSDLDLDPPVATAAALPQSRRLFLGLGSVAQVVMLTVLVNLGWHLLKDRDLSCASYPLCQTAQESLDQTQTYLQTTAVGAYSAIVDRFDEGKRTYQAGIDQALAASVLVQSAKTPADWVEVSARWQEAINAMESVLPQSRAYADAQAKRLLYQQYRNHALGEIDPFREGVNAAMAAAQQAQLASQPQDWQAVSSQWIEAISLMQAVPDSSAYYATAQNKIAEYAKNLAYSQSLSTNLRK